MSLRRWLAPALLLVITACQSPAPATPTTAPPPPAAVLPATKPAVPTPTPGASARATAPAATASRVETVNAANAAFQSGNLKTAAGLYDRVVNSPPGPAEGTATAAIDDFAHFRAIVSLLADGREDQARTHLDALQKRDPASSPLARLGNQLWDQYGMIGHLRGACAQLQPQIISQAGPVLATLQGVGVVVEEPTLCSAPQR
jgi:hypothetical protein